MEPSGLSVFRRLNARMQWLTERQTVLAENIANVNTPGYRARDMHPPDFASEIARTAPRAPTAPPQPQHFQLTPRLGPDLSGETLEGQQETISGNSVDMEVELKKAADAALEYQTMTHLYRKHLEMLRMASSNNGA